MHFLTSLLLVAGCVFVVCLGVVILAWELWQVSVRESPAFPETPIRPESSKWLPAKTAESYESSSTQLNDAQ
jgi:hypothetical protein